MVQEYPSKNRARARVLLELREKALMLYMERRGTVDPATVLNQQMMALLADIGHARDLGNDLLADAMVVQLDEVCKELEARGPEFNRQAKEARDRVTASLDEELERLKKG